MIEHFTPIAIGHSPKFLSMCINSQRFDIDSIDDLGFTALFRCCSRPEEMVKKIPEMVSILLKGGADPNKRCDARFEFPEMVKAEYTALMQAAESDSEQVIAILLKHGADKSLKNKDGRTALDLAKARGKNKAINALTVGL